MESLISCYRHSRYYCTQDDPDLPDVVFLALVWFFSKVFQKYLALLGVRYSVAMVNTDIV